MKDLDQMAETRGRLAYGTRSNVREKSKRETNARIVEAARNLFNERGYADTSIAEIVSESGVSRQTFYIHFQTKIDVLKSLVASFRAAVVGQYALLAAMRDPSLDDIKDWLESFLKICEKDRRTVILLLATQPADPDLAPYRQELFDELLTMLAQGHEAFIKARAGGDPVAHAEAICMLAQIETLPRLALSDQPLCDVTALIHVLATMLVKFLGPSSRPRAVNDIAT